MFVPFKMLKLCKYDKTMSKSCGRRPFNSNIIENISFICLKLRGSQYWQFDLQRKLNQLLMKYHQQNELILTFELYFFDCICFPFYKIFDVNVLEYVSVMWKDLQNYLLIKFLTVVEYISSHCLCWEFVERPEMTDNKYILHIPNRMQ